jgi:hypothetical protein
LQGVNNNESGIVGFVNNVIERNHLDVEVRRSAIRGLKRFIEEHKDFIKAVGSEALIQVLFPFLCRALFAREEVTDVLFVCSFFLFESQIFFFFVVVVVDTKEGLFVCFYIVLIFFLLFVGFFFSFSCLQG